MIVDVDAASGPSSLPPPEACPDIEAANQHQAHRRGDGRYDRGRRRSVRPVVFTAPRGLPRYRAGTTLVVFGAFCHIPVEGDAVVTVVLAQPAVALAVLARRRTAGRPTP